jgi:hypothetical protein
MTFVSPSRLFRFAAAMTMLALLAACANNGPAPEAAVAPQTSLKFVDLERFDHELSGSLAAPLPSVDVSFYDPVTPNSMPVRLQKWMAAVEEGGGSVKITPPQSTVTAKNPFLLLSLASSLWTANKMMKESAAAGRFKPAHAYDADIQLKVDGKGETVVDKVVFVQRKK